MSQTGAALQDNPFSLFGTDLFGDEIQPKQSGVVAERFTFPPFSVLDARQGEWQERKRAWSNLGIRGEVGDWRKAAQASGEI